MVNTRSKGNKQELRAQKELEKTGWRVQRCGYRLFQQNDFFGLFDILAIKPMTTKLVQVKSNRKPPIEEIKKILEFGNKYKQFQVEIWCWFDRKGWKQYAAVNGKLFELAN